MRDFYAEIDLGAGTIMRNHYLIITNQQFDYWKSSDKCMAFKFNHDNRVLGVLLVFNPVMTPLEEEWDHWFPSPDIEKVLAKFDDENLERVQEGLFSSLLLASDPDLSLVVMIADQNKTNEALVSDFIDRATRYPI
jgi:hypothetical protein